MIRGLLFLFLFFCSFAQASLDANNVQQLSSTDKASLHQALLKTVSKSKKFSCLRDSWISPLCSEFVLDVEYMNPAPTLSCKNSNEYKCNPILFGHSRCATGENFIKACMSKSPSLGQFVGKIQDDYDFREKYINYVKAIEKICLTSPSPECQELIDYLTDLNRKVMHNNSCFYESELEALYKLNENIYELGKLNSLLLGREKDFKEKDYYYYSKNQSIRDKKSLVRGAHEIMNSFFQNCEIGNYGFGIKNYKLDGKEVSETDFLKQTKSSQPNSCKENSKLQRSYYHFGEKPDLSQGKLKFSRYRDGGDYNYNHRVDCSGFVSGAMMLVGAKWTKDQGNRIIDHYLRGTENIGFIPRDEKDQSCFEYPKMNRYNSLQTGDLINFTNYHIVMVDSTSTDPFGLRHVKDLAECSKLSNDKFEFTIIHSAKRSSSKFASGVHRVHAKVLTPGLKYKMIAYARKLCETKFKPTENMRDRLWVGSARGGKPVRMSVLRHKADDPECFYKPPHKLFHNQQCAEDCLKKVQ